MLQSALCRCRHLQMMATTPAAIGIARNRHIAAVQVCTCISLPAIAVNCCTMAVLAAKRIPSIRSGLPWHSASICVPVSQTPQRCDTNNRLSRVCVHAWCLEEGLLDEVLRVKPHVLAADEHITVSARLPYEKLWQENGCELMQQTYNSQVLEASKLNMLL